MSNVWAIGNSLNSCTLTTTSMVLASASKTCTKEKSESFIIPIARYRIDANCSRVFMICALNIQWFNYPIHGSICMSQNVHNNQSQDEFRKLNPVVTHSQPCLSMFDLISDDTPIPSRNSFSVNQHKVSRNIITSRLTPTLKHTNPTLTRIKSSHNIQNAIFHTST